MVNEFVIENIKLQLNAKEIYFERIGWQWSDGTANSLVMDIDKTNDVAGILIFNFGVTTTGSNVQLVIKDNNNPTQFLYRNLNKMQESIVAPLIYFIKGNNVNLGTTVQTTFGFNYVTIRVNQ